jgi:hypothetical protein
MGRDRERKEQSLIRVCVFAENQGLGLLSPCGPGLEAFLFALPSEADCEIPTLTKD